MLFKSTHEFDEAIYTILQKLLNDEGLNDKPSQYSQEDYDDAMEHAVKSGFIAGLHADRVLSGRLMLQGNPRITRLGLSFVEAFSR